MCEGELVAGKSGHAEACTSGDELCEDVVYAEPRLDVSDERRCGATALGLERDCQ